MLKLLPADVLRTSMQRTVGRQGGVLFLQAVVGSTVMIDSIFFRCALARLGIFAAEHIAEYRRRGIYGLDLSGG